ncbi:lysozyme inhibitor LprI family protein [Luteolibacter marinus]|uniref:lysozyme inhibitor LprI family protein n=1 Tax=Luteolibacter marinus TaxID=2776705 RepID=UPI0018684803|nr:lysozyme inhibitor LprI family protein [Luteolibacter marinus]
MKAPWLALLLSATCVPAIAPAQSQAEMNAEAAAAFEKADKELNQVYVKVMRELDDESKQRLKVAQRAWVAFRDAEATFRADAEARGGSMWPMIHEGIRGRLTAQRVKSLKELLIDDGR